MYVSGTSGCFWHLCLWFSWPASQGASSCFLYVSMSPLSLKGSAKCRWHCYWWSTSQVHVILQQKKNINFKINLIVTNASLVGCLIWIWIHSDQITVRLRKLKCLSSFPSLPLLSTLQRNTILWFHFLWRPAWGTSCDHFVKTVPQFLRKSFEGWCKRELHSVTSAMSLYPRCLQLKLLNNRLKYVGNHKIFGNIEICDCLTIDCVSHLRRVGTITRRNVRTSNELYSEIFPKIWIFSREIRSIFPIEGTLWLCSACPALRCAARHAGCHIVIIIRSSGCQVVQILIWFDQLCTQLSASSLTY